eukprot:706054-Lingulodinium_polyedra.AAC.1
MQGPVPAAKLRETIKPARPGTWGPPSWPLRRPTWTPESSCSSRCSSARSRCGRGGAEARPAARDVEWRFRPL